MNKYKDTPIIMLALPRWDSQYSSTSYSLAKEFALTQKVFFIDNPFTWKDFFFMISSNQIRLRFRALLFGANIFSHVPDAPKDLIAVTPRLTLPINWMPSGKVYNWFSRLNDKIVFTAVRRLINKYELKEYIFVNSYNPLYSLSFPKSFKPILSIYHCVDDITESVYIRKHGPGFEIEMIKKSDFVFTTSTELKNLKSKYGTRTELIPNAANINLFKTALFETLNKPDDLQDYRGKTICYIGNIDLRTDVRLLILVAQRYSAHNLLLVGPVNKNEEGISELLALSNVSHVGSKDITELPAYLQYSDCAIIPFKCSVLTKSIYPLKINEYLAAGRPVVASNFSPDIESFKDICFISNNHETFINNIGLAIEQDDNSKRLIRYEYVKDNDWSSRAKMFWDYLNM